MSDWLDRTDRQILEVLEKALRDGHVVPTVREIAEACRVAKSTVHNRLRKLERLGLLRLRSRPGKRQARGIELVVEPPFRELFSLNSPQLSLSNFAVAAGPPMLARDPFEEGTLSQVLSQVRGDFAVKMGESAAMASAGVLAGDFVVVDQNAPPKHGDLVVAVTEDANRENQPVLRHFVRTDAGQPWLQAADPASPPIDLSRATVLGVVVALVRKY